MWSDAHGGWTRTDHFLADLIEQQHNSYRILCALAGVRRRPRPLVIKRPAPKKPRKSWIKDWASRLRG